jgi:hypothetical protein
VLLLAAGTENLCTILTTLLCHVPAVLKLKKYQLYYLAAKADSKIAFLQPSQDEMMLGA